MIIPHHWKKKDYDKFAYFIIAVGILATLPQVYQIYETQSATDLNIISWGVWTGSSFFWITYGVERKALPVAVSSIFKLILNLAVIYGIVIYS